MQAIIRNAIAGIALAGAALSAQADTVARAVGGTSIQVPVPAGFVEVTDPRMLDFARKNTSSHNRLLAVFVTRTDDERIRGGLAPQMERYFLLQTSRSLESASFSRSDFAQVKQVVRSQMTAAVQRALPQANKELRENLQDEPVQTEVQNIATDGVFFESDTALGVAMLGEVRFTTMDHSETVRMGSAATTAIAREKIIYFFAYAHAADMEWARGEARSWATQLDRANR